MLQYHLFTFSDLHTAGDIVKTNIELNPVHPIFEGHFPGNPVLPGVCMLQMVKEIAEAHVAKKIRLTLGQDLKFLSVIQPEKNAIIQMELKINIEEGKIKVAAVLQNDATIFFKFKGIFAQL